MQPVAADQRKEGGEKSATLRPCPRRDHAGELPHFQRKEAGAEHESDDGSQISGGIAPRTNGHGHQSAGVARSEKAGGLDRNAALVEQLRATWAAGGRVSEHRVSGEKRRKHHDVAQEEYPEAVANHDPLCSRTKLACTRQRLVTNLIVNCNSDVHTAISAWCTCSNRAICSAGISISSSGRNAKASMVTKAPIAPTPAIHQMCQINAKPVMTAKNAVTKPVALFFGTSIDSNLGSFGGAACVRSRHFFFQKASVSRTCGSCAACQAGRGGA